MAVRGRRLTIGLLAGVVVVLVVGTTTAVAISRRQHDAGGVAGNGTVTTGSDPSSVGSSPRSARPSVTTNPNDSRAASSAATSSNPISAPVGPSNNLTVQMSPAVQADRRSSAVQQLLQDYFDSINQHSYAAWTQLVTSDMARRQNSTQWLDAYATTVDSSIWMQSMTDDPLRVKLRFTSQQDPGLAPKDLQVDCIDWTLTYQITTQDGQLVVGSTVDGSVGYVKCP